MSTFAVPPASLPAPFDRARVKRTFAQLAELGYVPDDAAYPLLESAFGNSAYLSRLALREFALLPRLFAEGPYALLTEACETALAAADSGKEALAMQALRQAKRQVALVVALADIAGAFTLDDVTQSLTRFADAAVKGALRFALKHAAFGTSFESWPAADIEAATGLVVLAMGKYGGFELNYSSDIDLVTFYDAARFPFAKRGDPRSAALEAMLTTLPWVLRRPGSSPLIIK